MQDRITTNIELLNAYLKQLSNKDRVNSKDNNDQRPLWFAARAGDMDMVKLLLGGGADVNSKDKNDQTPLWWAARAGKMDMVKLLLSGGADVNSKDNNNQTPTAGPDALREAVGRFDVRAVEDILTQAFNDVARDNLNWLHELIEKGYGY